MENAESGDPNTDWGAVSSMLHIVTSDELQTAGTVAKLPGGSQLQKLALSPGDFRTTAGNRLKSWRQIDLLGLRAYYESDGTLLGSKSWAGPQPRFRKLYWDSTQNEE